MLIIAKQYSREKSAFFHVLIIDVLITSWMLGWNPHAIDLVIIWSHNP
jgi:hypothetical protein